MKRTSRWRCRLRSLFKGHSASLVLVFPYAGIKFLAYEQVRLAIIASGAPEKEAPWRRILCGSMADWLRTPALAPYTLEAHTQSSTRVTAVAQRSCGAVAGIVAQTISYPIDIIRRQIQVERVGDTESSILETARGIFLDRGVRGFYVGLTIGYVKIAPMVATSFYVYNQMKRFLGLIE
ncbi:unnamed protein product [Penicillium nalgiovense]|nr:unnamed protein product [Penicillium nalgiovense]